MSANSNPPKNIYLKGNPNNGQVEYRTIRLFLLELHQLECPLNYPPPTTTTTKPAESFRNIINFSYEQDLLETGFKTAVFEFIQ